MPVERPRGENRDPFVEAEHALLMGFNALLHSKGVDPRSVINRGTRIEAQIFYGASGDRENDSRQGVPPEFRHFVNSVYAPRKVAIRRIHVYRGGMYPEDKGRFDQINIETILADEHHSALELERSSSQQMSDWRGIVISPEDEAVVRSLDLQLILREKPWTFRVYDYPIKNWILKKSNDRDKEPEEHEDTGGFVDGELDPQIVAMVGTMLTPVLHPLPSRIVESLPVSNARKTEIRNFTMRVLHNRNLFIGNHKELERRIGQPSRTIILR